jgi:murein DD-endopeptidase MepM/ murein hydrolase activator NlpD
VTSRWRAAGIVVLTTTALAAGAMWRAGAQLVGPPDSTTTAPQGTTPTSITASTVLPKPTTTTPAPKPTTPPEKTPALPPPPSSTTTTTKPGSQTVPPDAQAQINAVKRTPANSTGALIQALQALEDFGLTPQEAINFGFGHFPVAGAANWSDDWLMPRFTPTFHMHQGNDIFAAMGTPVRAVSDGTVRWGEEPVGGKAFYLTTSDGTYYYCAHLSDWPKDIPPGSRVKQGTIIGFVGNTGDAMGGSPHCHFEVHPKGGAAVDPKSTLDGWVNEAMANIPALIGSFQANAPKAVAAAGFIRRFDVGDQGMFSAPGRPPASPLLWASSVNPAGGALRLAQAEVAQAAGEVDWERLLARQEEEAQAWQQAHAAVTAILQPVTPPALAPLFSSTMSS